MDKDPQIQQLLDRIATLEQLIAKQSEEISQLQVENTAVKAENAALRSENETLKKRLNKDSGNSSNPPQVMVYQKHHVPSHCVKRGRSKVVARKVIKAIH
jgi:regulator of replication initiation timing